MTDERYNGLVFAPILRVEQALKIQKIVLRNARQISGFIVIYGSNGMELCSQALGEGTPTNAKIAHDKIKTVLTQRRSTLELKRRMMEQGYERDDYAGTLGSLFAGGVAIFADEMSRDNSL